LGLIWFSQGNVKKMAKVSKIIISILAILLTSFRFVFAQNLPYEEGQVYVCPLAKNMEEVNPKCPCRIDLILGETVTSTCNGENYEMTLTITTYEDKEYYAILGFENGGAGVNLKPEANAGGPYEGFVRKEIIFDGSKSSDPNGDPLDFSWDFGDGNFGSGEKVSHIYQNPGQYSITLTVSDGMATSTATTTVKISIASVSETLRRSFVKKEIAQVEKPIQPEKEIEKPEIKKEIPIQPPEIVETPKPQPEIKIEKPKVAGAQIPPKITPSLLASLIEVFKEKPFLPFCTFVSLFALIIYLSWKIKNFLSSRKI
jgi:hypothetical protein